MPDVELLRNGEALGMLVVEIFDVLIANDDIAGDVLGDQFLNHERLSASFAVLGGAHSQGLESGAECRLTRRCRPFGGQLLVQFLIRHADPLLPGVLQEQFRLDQIAEQTPAQVLQIRLIDRVALAGVFLDRLTVVDLKTAAGDGDAIDLGYNRDRLAVGRPRQQQADQQQPGPKAIISSHGRYRCLLPSGGTLSLQIS